MVCPDSSSGHVKKVSIYIEEVYNIMDWGSLLHGVIDTAIYCLVGIVMMGIGILLVILFSPFSVKKEIEDDQNISLGLIIGAIIIGISIIIAGVLMSPGSDSLKRKTAPIAEVKVEEKALK
jgi:putative membrane protein